MTRDLARLVAPSGAAFSAPIRNLTPQSVFVAGRVGLGFGDLVKVFLLGHGVDARVAFVAADPPGVVLTFFAPPELLRAIEDPAPDGPLYDWSDEDVTGTHEGGEAALLATMMARAEAASVPSTEVDPEDPTNTGSRVGNDLEDEVTPPARPAVVVEERSTAPDPAEAQEGLLRPAAASDRPDGSGAMRLRATTQVSDRGSHEDSTELD